MPSGPIKYAVCNISSRPYLTSSPNLPGGIADRSTFKMSSFFSLSFKAEKKLRQATIAALPKIIFNVFICLFFIALGQVWSKHFFRNKFGTITNYPVGFELPQKRPAKICKRYGFVPRCADQ